MLDFITWNNGTDFADVAKGWSVLTDSVQLWPVWAGKQKPPILLGGKSYVFKA